MSVRKCLIVFAFSFLVSTSAGCLGPPWSKRTYETVVPGLPKDAIGEIDKSIIKLHLGSLTLSTQVQAFDLDGRFIAPPLGVWINIKPQQGTLLFQTSQVKLKIEGQDEISPVYYLGPETKWLSYWTLAAGCGPSVYRRGLDEITGNPSPNTDISIKNVKNSIGIYRPSDEPIQVAKESCFILWFDTDSLPDYGLILDIEGIKHEGNGNEVFIPEIHFKPVRIKELRF